jgi:hypothetical protein
VHKPNALSLLDLADHSVCRHQLKKHAEKVASPIRSLNARAALKVSLLLKRQQQSNMWLARELGYKTEKEHLKDCLEVEQRKQNLILKKEQERLQRNQLLRERMLEGIDVEEEADAHADEEDQQETVPDQEEEDEEMAMAREIEQNDIAQKDNEDQEEESAETMDIEEQSSKSVKHNDNSTSPDEEMDDASAIMDNDCSVSSSQESKLETQPPMFQEESQITSRGEEIIPKLTNESDATGVEDSEKGFNNDQEDVENEGAEDSSKDSKNGQEDEESQRSEENVSSKKSEGHRNSAWKAMLEKEAAQAKKMKSSKSGWVEDEADEEEDEQVAGLEDFGFSVYKKKKEDEDIEDEINEEDLKHVVDEVSDDEGDEDAGEKARKAMEQQEEKERHKEIMRRMRDGYDGRRGGIAASGFGSRGVHRFEQLVAADNREDAKRLGLLNEDEMESDNEDGDEKKSGDDEEEDEGALLDKMLKDRFLHRSSVGIEENFSNDEEESEDEQGENKDGQEDDEDKEQDRLAKRFAKRARMQRLIEEYGQEEEFSQSKLMEEDVSLKLELQKMKVRVI